MGYILPVRKMTFTSYYSPVCRQHIQYVNHYLELICKMCTMHFLCLCLMAKGKVGKIKRKDRLETAARQCVLMVFCVHFGNSFSFKQVFYCGHLQRMNKNCIIYK